MEAVVYGTCHCYPDASCWSREAFTCLLRPSSCDTFQHLKFDEELGIVGSMEKLKNGGAPTRNVLVHHFRPENAASNTRSSLIRECRCDFDAIALEIRLRMTVSMSRPSPRFTLGALPVMTGFHFSSKVWNSNYGFLQGSTD